MYSRMEFEHDLMRSARANYNLGELQFMQNPREREVYERLTVGANATLARLSSDIAWRVYQKSFQQGGDMFMGRLAQTRQLYWVFDLDGQNRYNLSPGGAINVQKLKDWSILINDCWVLGAVHAHKRFVLETDINGANGFWDATNNRYFVTGRELVGLEMFGYQMETTPGTNMTTFVCDYQGMADRASLTRYSNKMNGLNGGMVEKMRLLNWLKGIRI